MKDSDERRSVAPRVSEGPWQLADYYRILGLGSGFSDLQLLRRFLHESKRAMAVGDAEAIVDVRRAFEVLRYEDTRIAYFRMHRLLIRHEPLRFPEPKKREMLEEIRLKEALGTNPVVKPETGYSSLLGDVLFDIALLDLSGIFALQASGVVLILAVPIIIAVNGVTWLTMGICVMLAVGALLYLKSHARDYVTYPRSHRP